MGVMLTTAALFVILSAFSGLRSFNLSLIDKTDPDLRIFPRQGKYFVYSDTVKKIVKQNENISSVSKVVEEKALLRYKDKQAVVLVRGVDTLYQTILNPADVLLTGEWPEKNLPEILVGQQLANKLSLNVFDPSEPVFVMIPSIKKKMGFNSQLITKPFIVSGIFHITPETEKKYVYMPLDVWQNILSLNNEKVSFLDIKLKNSGEIQTVKTYLKNHLPENLAVMDRLEMNRTVLKMLNLENLVTYVIGLLFLIISAFNIVGSIIILILKKKKDRFVFSALGLDLSSVKKIFFLYGNLLIFLSGMAGLVLGIIIVWAQKKFELVNVPGTFLVYPVEFRLKNFLIVIITLLLVSLVSSWLASYMVKEIKEKV